MAVSATGDGVFETILRAKDEASAVVQDFAAKTKEALTGAGKSAEETGKKTEESALKTTVAWGTVSKAVSVGAAAAVAAGIAVFKAGVEAADAAGKAAQKVGLTVEQLTAWQYAAKLANVEQGALNASLIQFNRNLEKAAETGKGAAASALEQLQLDAEELRGLGLEESLLRISEAMAKLPEGVDAGRIAVELFGKAGAGMVNVLGDGREKTQGLLQDAHDLGVVISTEAAKSAGEFNDNLTKTAAYISGIRTELTNNTLKAFAALSGRFSELVINSGAAEGAAKILTVTLKTLAFGVNVVADAFGVAGRILGGSAAIIGSVLKGEFREALRIGKEMGADIADTLKRSDKIYRDILNLDQQIQQNGDRAKGQFKKSAFEPDQYGGGFVKTGGVSQGAGTFSDVLPGAELITAQNDQELRALDEQQAAVEERTRGHHERLLQIDTDARSIRFAMGVKYDKLSLDAAGFFFGQLGALMQTKSRALFEIGKVGAIAETMIATYKGAQQAYAALAGIPVVGPALGAAAAAAAVAVGLARVQAIRSTSFGSASGSPVLSSGGTSGPVVSSGTAVAVPAQPLATQPQFAQTQQQVNITLQGSAFSANTIRDELIPLLNDALGDGVRLNVASV